MTKSNGQNLDAQQLRAAMFEAVHKLGNGPKKQALVNYLVTQAQDKPAAFLSLLLKLVQMEQTSASLTESQRLVRIEIVPCSRQSSALIAADEKLINIIE